MDHCKGCMQQVSRHSGMLTLLHIDTSLLSHQQKETFEGAVHTYGLLCPHTFTVSHSSDFHKPAAN